MKVLEANRVVCMCPSCVVALWLFLWLKERFGLLVWVVLLAWSIDKAILLWALVHHIQYEFMSTS